jgi:hypothetical protein
VLECLAVWNDSQKQTALLCSKGQLLHMLSTSLPTDSLLDLPADVFNERERTRDAERVCPSSTVQTVSMQ